MTTTQVQRPRVAAPRVTLPKPSRDQITVGIILGSLLALSIWSFSGVGLSLTQISKGIGYAENFLLRTVPFVWPSFPEIIRLSGLTLAIVICGTVMAAVLSIPVAYLAARNTSPARGTRWIGRMLSVTSRAAPDAILAMIFALIIGQGALAGVLALGLHSIGMISKLTADAIEQIDEGPRLALRATGATKSQEFWGAIWPQIAPAFVATVLHRTDINLRVSVILGFVGVAGLGYELSIALRTLNYREAMPYAIIIFILCVLFEVISAMVRTLLLGKSPAGKGIGDRVMRMTGAGKTAAVGAVGAADSAAGGAAGGAAVRAETGGRVATSAASRTRPWTPDRIKTATFGWLAGLAILGSIIISATQGSSFTNFWQNLSIAGSRLWPPSLAESKWAATGMALIETVQIALAATLFALIFSLVIGAFAARNVAPTPAVRGSARLLLVGIRGLPELLLALFFIILTGLGPGAATLALGIGGIGLLGKLFADSIEEVRSGPERALTATGATRFQVFTAATFPQATPALVGHTLYLLDSNIRGATILGIVGGGGIGTLLASAARINQHELLFLLICVLLIVFAVEALSSWIRGLIQ